VPAGISIKFVPEIQMNDEENNTEFWSHFCESPIEIKLAVAISIYLPARPARAFEKMPERVEVSKDIYPFIGTDQYLLSPQVQHGKYRADFVLTRYVLDSELNEAGDTEIYFLRKSSIIAIECDGHDFHDRTKEQAQRDRARDRYFTSQGFLMARFTGSEIHKNAQKCVSEIEAIADSKW
jgi:very-short-patch-repair endonuclease